MIGRTLGEPNDLLSARREAHHRFGALQRAVTFDCVP